MGNSSLLVKLIPLSKIAPVQRELEDIDSVAYKKSGLNGRRAFDVLMEAQHYWNQMDVFRKDRERNKRYAYGRQWGDIIDVGCKSMSEEDYIKEQGNVPLKNNLIRRFIRNVLGIYRGQMKEPSCTARDRDEQRLGETMSIILQCNMQLNRMDELYARSMEEYLISGLIVHRKSYGWRNGKEDCWTDYVQPNNFFIDNNMRDFRGWDVSFLGEVHDVDFGQLCSQFAHSTEDYVRLKEIYTSASQRGNIVSLAEKFGYSRLENYDFLFTSDPSRCRVVEVWKKEQKPRYRCHDYLSGDIYKIEIDDYDGEVLSINEQRLRDGLDAGMEREDIPLIKATWFMDDYWYFYYLSPFGDILKEGETPFLHGSHPYVFKAYPFIDGEIHSFVSDIIDQQRYVNRLITLYDWIMRASAKGVLLVPEESIGNMSLEEIADEWTRFNGVIAIKTKNGVPMPQQISNNSTNIGIGELLNIQLRFFEDISGVSGALQGKPGYSGMSASLYAQQAQNSSTSLLDLLESFSYFVVDGAYKDVKNMQQFYDSKRVFNIAGKSGADIVYDPNKIRDVEFDLSITESTATPTYRMLANDILMELWKAQAISVEQLLEHGNFPFSDELLQSIKVQKEQVEQGVAPDGISPELMAQAQQGVDMNAVNQLYGAMKGQ